MTWEINNADTGNKYKHTLSLSNGKPSKYTYEYKGSTDGKERKTTITVKYSANISTPTDLPTAEE